MTSLSATRHGTALLWTATLGTSPERSLGSLRDDLVRLLQATTGGGWLARQGVTGTARCVEPERSPSGWHVHAHTLLIFEKQLSPADVAEFELTLRRHYLRQADRLGISASAEGQHVRTAAPLSVAVDYITKSRIRANGHDAPSALWTDAMRGDADALALVHELEAGTFRRRSWTTTGVCRPLLDLDALLASGRV